MKVLIRTEKLCKYYGKKGKIKALDGLDLEVYEGETFGLLGPNGSGKTTTVWLLTKLLKPSKGTATINGYDILKDGAEIKRITGLLAESPGLYEKLSAFEFLEFMGTLYDVPKDSLSRRIKDLLKLFGLYERRNDLLEGYSQGMKQKVLIAATIIHDPTVLFLDEPISKLDPHAAHMVKDLIKKLANDAGKTIFICSHTLALVEEICDRIGILNNGKLIALGTIDEIIAQTGTETLEDAFITLTGGFREKDLLNWRNNQNVHA